MCAPSGMPAVEAFQSPGDIESCSRHLGELQAEDRLADFRSADDLADPEITHDKLKALTKEVNTARTVCSYPCVACGPRLSSIVKRMGQGQVSSTMKDISSLQNFRLLDEIFSEFDAIKAIAESLEQMCNVGKASQIGKKVSSTSCTV